MAGKLYWFCLDLSSTLFGCQLHTGYHDVDCSSLVISWANVSQWMWQKITTIIKGLSICYCNLFRCTHANFDSLSFWSMIGSFRSIHNAGTHSPHKMFLVSCWQVYEVQVVLKASLSRCWLLCRRREAKSVPQITRFELCLRWTEQSLSDALHSWSEVIDDIIPHHHLSLQFGEDSSQTIHSNNHTTISPSRRATPSTQYWTASSSYSLHLLAMMTDPAQTANGSRHHTEQVQVIGEEQRFT
jgi:hypothetical protein